MKVIDKPLLREMGLASVCGACGWMLTRRPHVHHLRAKGIGGGSRLDVRINLIPLGSELDCNCHGSHHDGNWPTYVELLAKVAAREGTTPEAIKDEVDRLLAVPADPGERRPRKQPTRKIRPAPFSCLLCRRTRRTVRRRDTPKGPCCGRCWDRATSEARSAAMKKGGAA